MVMSIIIWCYEKRGICENFLLNELGKVKLIKDKIFLLESTKKCEERKRVNNIFAQLKP